MLSARVSDEMSMSNFGSVCIQTFNTQLPAERLSGMSEHADAHIEWNYGGGDVYVVCYHKKNRKKKAKLTQQEDGNFAYRIQLPPGVYYFYFVVDGKKRFSPDYPVMKDATGKILNYVKHDIRSEDEDAVQETYNPMKNLISQESVLTVDESRPTTIREE